VGESISLKPLRGGSDYVGLCPFHDDHNPSFHVYPDRQSYRCWVCDEMGDCFTFVMKLDGSGFREALEMLATRAGLEMPKNHGSARAGSGREEGLEKGDLYKVLAWAENEFHRCLLSSASAAKARDYLQERGFTQETIRQFKLGYHPNDWEWLQGRAKGSFTPAQLLAARLVKQRDRDNGYYDDFVDRVMFPIRDIRARTVAFGGRILPGDDRANAPKYSNSAESKLFTKSDVLYGFDAARDAIRRSETAVVVEGYTDCIIAHQHGIRNVVGTLGTALTETHVGSLKRLARRVVQCFDGDEAGRKAVDRSLVKFVAQDVELRILTLPGGADPAEFLAERGPEEFQRLIDGATELWEHKLKLTFDRFGFDSPKAREDIVSEMLGLLAQSPRLAGTQREHLLLNRLSQRVGLPEQVVRQHLGEARQ
jgi:DNA primase